MNCPNCGAALKAHACAYCGTLVEKFEDEDGPTRVSRWIFRRAPSRITVLMTNQHTHLPMTGLENVQAAVAYGTEAFVEIGRDAVRELGNGHYVVELDFTNVPCNFVTVRCRAPEADDLYITSEIV